jgi:DNA-3-methyladenine glycosylase II
MATGIRGLKALVDKDAAMARAFQLAGQPPSRRRPPGFASLLRIIVNQQVSTHAGRAIWRRLEVGLGEVTPERVLTASPRKLKSLGLSRAKTRYARALAGQVASTALDIDSLAGLDDDGIRAILTKVPGVGPWTAEIYMMFALGRPDVWPAGDLALAEAAKRLLDLKSRPTPGEMAEIGEIWRPWRTAAAVMLWHYYAHARQTGGNGT